MSHTNFSDFVDMPRHNTNLALSWLLHQKQAQTVQTANVLTICCYLQYTTAVKLTTSLYT